jgi:glycosyltransferase involved in cell wall biosynthesis
MQNRTLSMCDLAKPLVSILTPVFNGERYLSQCIESVLAQSYTNWEYIIVNNCSTDRTLEIAQAYASQDIRIRIHNNTEFARIAKNHNIAFRQISASSEYCKVVFADDWIFPDCLERMVQAAEENPSAAIVGAYGLLGSKVVWDGLPCSGSLNPSSLIGGREICRQKLLEGFYVFGTATSVLFRSDVIRRRRDFLNESNLHADSEVCLDILKDSDFSFVHQVLTFTRERDESMTAYSRKFNTYMAAILGDLVKHGPYYLSTRELDNRLRQHLSRYYRFLARNIFKLREREFWKFHAGKMRTAGFPLSYGRLTWAAFVWLVDIFLNPKYSLEIIVRRLLSGYSGAKEDSETAATAGRL